LAGVRLVQRKPRVVDEQARQPVGDGAVGAAVEVSMAGDHTLEIVPSGQTARVTLRTASGHELLAFEIEVTAAGAVVKGTAAALQIDAAKVSTRCDSFVVEARETIELRSAGRIVQEAGGSLEARASSIDLEAKQGAFRARANDDVQLLGEQILLNCDREPVVPRWASTPWVPPAPISKELQSGDQALLADLAAPVDTDGAE
jgi:hypothetical protein